MTPSDAYLALAGLEPPEPEYLFARPRKWRIDLAWPRRLLAVEIEGGVWIAGRHNRGRGYLADLEKYNELALRGWHLIRLTPGMLDDGSALAILERAAQAFPEVV